MKVSTPGWAFLQITLGSIYKLCTNWGVEFRAILVNELIGSFTHAISKIGSIGLITLLMTLLMGGLGSVALSQKQPNGLSGNTVKAIASTQVLPSAKQNQSNEQVLLDIEGELGDGDQVLPQDGSLYDEHTFEGRAGQSVAIDLESDDFDTFLILLDPQERIVGQHDDVSQNDLNSTLNVTLPVDGIYTIVANGFDSNSRGRYRLLVRTPTQSASQ